jgi:hypothetical protein
MALSGIRRSPLRHPPVRGFSLEPAQPLLGGPGARRGPALYVAPSSIMNGDVVSHLVMEVSPLPSASCGERESL